MSINKPRYFTLSLHSSLRYFLVSLLNNMMFRGEVAFFWYGRNNKFAFEVDLSVARASSTGPLPRS